MDFVMSVIRAVRSMRADYQLTKTKTDCKYQCSRAFIDQAYRHAKLIGNALFVGMVTIS